MKQGRFPKIQSWRIRIVILVAISGFPYLAGADSNIGGPKPKYSLVHSAKTQIWLLYREDCLKGTYRRDEYIRLPKNEEIYIEVTDTNTLLRSHSLKKEYVPQPDIAAIQGFLGALGPYAIDVGMGTKAFTPALDPDKPEGCTAALQEIDAELGQLRELLRASNHTPTIEEDIKANLEIIDTSIHGANGIRDSYTKAVRAIPALAEKPDDWNSDRDILNRRFRNGRLKQVDDLQTALTGIAGPYRDGFLKSGFSLSFDHPGGPGRTEDLDLTGEELVSLVAQALKSELAVCQANPIYRDVFKTSAEFTDLSTKAKGALRDSQALMTAAMKTETFAQTVAFTSSKWTTKIRIPRREGLKLTLTATRRAEPEFNRYSDHLEDHTSQISVLPEIGVRPSVGLSLLWTDSGVYPQYGTREATQGGETGVEIFQSGTKDARFTYGLTMGLTYTWADLRHRPSRFALWLPEVMVSPSSEERAFGVGIGASWKALKLSVGAQWIRHIVLDGGQEVGDFLPDAGSLKTKETYGSPEIYIGISVIGWPPFKQGD